MTTVHQLQPSAILSYAESTVEDPQALIGRMWWMAIIWSASYVLWSVSFLARFLISASRAGSPLATAYLSMQMVSTLCAAAFFVLLLWRNKQAVLRRDVRIVATILLATLVGFVVRYAVQFVQQPGSSPPAYSILLATEGVAMYGLWWMPLLAFLMAGRILRDPLRAPGWGKPARQFVTLLAFCVAFGLAFRHITELAYLVVDGVTPSWQMLREFGWQLIAGTAVLLSFSAAMLVWCLWRRPTTNKYLRLIGSCARCCGIRST